MHFWSVSYRDIIGLLIWPAAAASSQRSRLTRRIAEASPGVEGTLGAPNLGFVHRLSIKFSALQDMGLSRRKFH